MTVKVDKDTYPAIHEADLEFGDPLVLQSAAGSNTFSVASIPGKLVAGYQSAWRVVLRGNSPGALIDSHLIELLNPEPTGNFSCVKPGVAVWDWRINGAKIDGFIYGMNYKSWIRMIDFASENNMLNLVLDSNWYGPEHESDSNPLDVEKSQDVIRIIQYGRQKGVGVWLYLNDVSGPKYPIEKTLKQYSDWGAAGIKYGFMNGSPVEKNRWTRKITALWPQNHLLCDFHDGPVHPYGQMRTFPNAITREYCHSQLDAHRVFVPATFLTSIFVNMVAGPIDMNNGMIDTLDKHFQQILHLTKSQSSLIQFSLYGAYFGMALPAGFFMRRFGYKKGIVLGLSLFATGAFLIAGTTSFESFWVFLSCLFILGCGLATLETAANPYATKLGTKESAAHRINFSQSFNGLAWVIGPLIGLYIYGNQGAAPGEKLTSMILPFASIGLVVLIVALIFLRLPLPEISEEETGYGHGIIESSVTEKPTFHKPLIMQRHFVMGVVSQFCYVATQTGIFSYLINFVTDKNQYPRFDVQNGPYFLSIGFALFMIGRMSGSYIMARIKPARILAVNAGLSILLLPIVSMNLGWASLIALYSVFLLMSIMFPTIFALGIRDLGPQTKKGASIIVMAIVGGAVFPPFMGHISDLYSMSIGFLAPIPLFMFILYYAMKGHHARP